MLELAPAAQANASHPVDPLMTPPSNPLVGCTMGDPAGIGPEVLLRGVEQLLLEDRDERLLGGPLLGRPSPELHATLAAAQEGEPPAPPGILLVGDATVLCQRAAELDVSLTIRPVPDAATARAAHEAGEPGPWVIDCTDASGVGLGRPSPASGRASLECLAVAAALAETGQIDALATAPLSKELVALHQPRFLGHTEYLAERASLALARTTTRYSGDTSQSTPAISVEQIEPIMLFAGPRPHVALLSTHLPLVTALARIRRPTVVRMLARLSELWSGAFGDRPRIALAALNPHAGEGGRLGGEEADVLAPAVVDARVVGVDAVGPYAADSVFLRPDVDVILALYHDQGTIIAKRSAVPTTNVTLGLPYPRTSPDHGTAFDLAVRGGADARPMLQSLKMAAELAHRQPGR